MVAKKRNKKSQEFKKSRDIAKKKESIRKLRGAYRHLFYFLLICFCCVTLYVFLFSPFLVVSKFDIYGTNALSENEVQGFINSRYGGRFLSILPKNNFIMIFPGSLEDKILERFKRIEKVEVEKVFPDKVEIRINEREALILWCKDMDCHVLDRKGVSYNKVELDSKEAQENNLVKVVSGENKGIEEGEVVLDETRIEFLVKAKEEILRFTGIDVKNEFFIRSRRADEFLAETQDGWKIFISTKFPLEKSAKTLALLMEKKSEDIDFEKLEYIDLRIEDKVFIKDEVIENECEDNEEECEEIKENLEDESMSSEMDREAYIKGKTANKKKGTLNMI